MPHIISEMFAVMFKDEIISGNQRLQIALKV